MRSLLLVDAADHTALDGILDTTADAVVVNLADPTATPAVLELLQTAHLSTQRPLIYIRLPSIDSDDIDATIAAIMAGEPDGFVLGRCYGGRDVQHLSVKLAVQEAVHGLADGETPIVAEAGASARALFAMETFCGASDRLMGLAWDPQALAADLGIDQARPGPASPLATARNLTIIAARAAEVCAIDGLSAFDDPAAFRADCEQARSDGFNAKVAASAAEVAIINAVFDPGG